MKKKSIKLYTHLWFKYMCQPTNNKGIFPDLIMDLYLEKI